jgi:DNA polymerase-3 subunit gamma/tau
MNYIVSALKYRPQKFEEVVGQQAVTNTLKNAIAKDHLAKALLFTGPRGVGKTTCARILAREINQSEALSDEEDFAFNIFELDAASNNSVDDIRNLIEQVRIPPQVGKYKVYIIDEVHMLSTQAFNAFLKTLEEPPAHAIFILATTEKHKIIPTILSRCQIYDFKRISAIDIKDHLREIVEKENLEADDDALFLIAQKADGALRDSLSLFDKVVSYSEGKITRKIVSESMSILDYDAYFKVVDFMLDHDIPGIISYFNQLLQQGFDAHQFVAGLSGHLRDLLVAKDPKTVDLLEVSDNIKQQYLTQSKSLELPYLMKALDLSTETDINYKLSKSPHLLVELCLMKLASLPDSDQAKKKVVDILPASYFRHTTQIVEELKSVTEKSVVKEPPAEQIVVTNTETSAKKQTKTRKSGGLSLAGFKNKKNELIENERRLAGEVLPTDSFTEEEFFKYWKLYLDNLRKNQEKNLLSILSIDPSPKLEGAKIGLVLSNNSLKKELERNKEKVLKYLRTNLNNFDIDFKITVNEEKQKDFVYTRPQKFQKMLEKYPDLQYLKDKFDLDV